ncbi:MAG: hydrogenase small subunit [Desulfurobacteriaceae bacterium]
MDLERREFFKYLAYLGGLLGLPSTVSKAYGETLKRIKEGEIRILILSGQSCSGCLLSSTYSDSPYFSDLVLMIKSFFTTTFSASDGEEYLREVFSIIERGNYILTLEGSVPGNPMFCEFGDYPYTEVLLKAVKNASFIVNMGTCASFGGIPAADGNPTGAMSVSEFLKRQGLSVPYINVPGCPVRSDRILSTWLYIATFEKLPPLHKKLKIPKMFFGDLIHNNCERYQYFNQDVYASYPGDGRKCLLAIGCRGPITRGDCSYVRWNCGKNYCISAATPCIGCSNPNFPFKEPMYVSKKEILKDIKIEEK